MSRHSLISRFLCLLVLGAAAGCSDDPGPEADQVAEKTQVVVELALGESAGLQVAGVLYAEADPAEVRLPEGMGGFTVDVDSDAFTASAVVTRGGRMGRGDFPYVTDEPLHPQPGAHTLLVWRGRVITPYSRWVPAGQRDLAMCQLPFDVAQDGTTTVTITGFPQHSRPRQPGDAATCRTS